MFTPAENIPAKVDVSPIKEKGISYVTKEYEAIVNFIQSDLKW